ncbi:MAG: HAD family hydrolase [Deltaproteobacteria bacterium]|nr:HAD family hydrolase [Deltaproteobacteria bacterium]
MGALLFDLDGTLVDTSPDIINAVEKTMFFLGLEFPGGEKVKSYLGKGPGKLILDCLGDEFNEELYKKAQKYFSEVYLNNIVVESVLYPGILQVLEEFSDVPKAIVTNKTPVYTEETLNILDLKKYFDFVYSASEVNPSKPHPYGCERALEKLGQKAGDSVMIGDTEIDYQTAKNTGLKSCLVSWGFRSRPQLEKLSSDILLDNPLELLTLRT